MILFAPVKITVVLHLLELLKPVVLHLLELFFLHLNCACTFIT